MSLNENWDIYKYKEEHESDEHWELRRAFMERWKDNYSEDRLICLSKVFINMECMGCSYPKEVMAEVHRLTSEIVKSYRKMKKTKLQRTFVSASTMAQDRAKGTKRIGGVIVEPPPAKTTRIEFVPATKDSTEPEHKGEVSLQNYDPYKVQSETLEDTKENDTEAEEKYTEANVKDTEAKQKDTQEKETTTANKPEQIDYLQDMRSMKCLEVKRFKETMFNTEFGRMVMLIRPWADKLWNVQASCQACHIPILATFEDNWFTLIINGKMVARVNEQLKNEAKAIAGNIAWKRLREQMVCLLVKEQWIAHGDSRISVSEVSGGSDKEDTFGTPVENNVAIKMMQMMGWKGGGLGVDAQGISEPIRANIQMVNRAGLGSNAADERQLRRAAHGLMQRYLASDTLDLDLVFSSDFSKTERAVLHQCAKKAGLSSRSYGEKDKDRYLVVNKRLDPFSLVRAVVAKGGNTPKYQVFIPEILSDSASSSSCVF